MFTYEGNDVLEAAAACSLYQSLYPEEICLRIYSAECLLAAPCCTDKTNELLARISNLLGMQLGEEKRLGNQKIRKLIEIRSKISLERGSNLKLKSNSF